MLTAHAEARGDQAEGADSRLLDVVADDLAAYLDRQILFEELVSDLDLWLEPVEFAAGETIAATGDKLPGALLLASGRASRFDASGHRLAEYGPGDVIGRIAPAGGASAHDVRASEPCRALLLTAGRRRPAGEARTRADAPLLPVRRGAQGAVDAAGAATAARARTA